MNDILDEMGQPIYPFHKSKEFPNLPVGNFVERENFLETIARLFDEYQMVFLEGDEGYGATTTAAQFCKKYADSTFCIFVKPASKITYSPDYIRLSLSEQFSWFVNKTEFTGEIADVNTFKSYVYKLRKRATKKKPIYFVIDGIHKISNNDIALEEIFGEILPLSFPDIKFLICGKETSFAKYTEEISKKYIQQIKFSSLETEKFLNPIVVDESDLRTIHTLCDGVPGRLASVRRLLLNNFTLNDILQSAPSKFPEFIKLEFSCVQNLNEKEKELLSIITFSNRQITENELCLISKADISNSNKLFSDCKFVFKNEDNGRIEFASDAHRKFAGTLLESERNFALESHIKHLCENPQSAAAVNDLPMYYQQLDKTSELIDLLTPEHFSQLLQMTSSLGALRARSNIGLKAAIELMQPNDALIFSLMQSMFLGIAAAEDSDQEIRALVSLGEHQKALSISLSSVTNEEKLKFLSTYARRCKETTTSIDPEILDLIRGTAKYIDFSQLGETAIDMASEIIHVDPDLAMSIVDDALKGSPNKADRDMAIARISIEASASDTGKTTNKGASLSAKNISDEKLQAFVSSVLVLVSDYSGEEIIKTSERLDPRRQLAFLGYWIQQHSDSESAINVTEHGLNLMISNSTHIPKMREFAALAKSLPLSKNISSVDNLIKRFDSQRGLIKDTSISTDAVDLQMTLAHAEMGINHTSAASRIVDCYFDLSASGSCDTKLEGFSIILSSLKNIDKEQKIEAEHGLSQVLKEELSELIKDITKKSADQFLILKFSLGEFSHFDYEQAISIAKSINTEDRRDAAFMEIIRKLYLSDTAPSLVPSILATIDYINDIDYAEQIFADLIQNFALRKLSIPIKNIQNLEGHLKNIKQDYVFSKSCISLFKIHHHNSIPLNHELVTILEERIGKIDGYYHQGNLFFGVCDVVSTYDKQLAKDFYQKGIKTKELSLLPSTSFNQILTYSLGLYCRAVGSAIRAKLFDENQIARFLKVSDLIPATSTRIDILCDFACRAWVNNRHDIAKRISGAHVLPAIETSVRSGSLDAKYLISLSFPILYCTHSQVALSYIRKIPRIDRDAAVSQTIDLILSKFCKSDPDFSDVKEEFAITFSEVLEILPLIEILSTDTNIYNAIRQTVASVSSKVNKGTFTSQQKFDIADRIESAYYGKLPDQFNIQHSGYLILCKAHLEVLRGNISIASWQEIINEADAITNTADKGFVLSELASLLPTKFSAKRAELQEQALQHFFAVPSVVDKINRLIGLSKGLSKDGIAIAKQALKSAIVMTLQTNDEQLAKTARRRIIDAADKINPSFAEELAELVDDDVARGKAKSEVKDRLKMLAVKKKLSNVKESQDVTNSEIPYLPEAAWKNVQGLLSGRIEIKPPQFFMDYLRRSATSSLTLAYPVLSWYIENHGKKYSGSKEASSQVLSLSEKLLVACEFGANVMARIAARKSDGNKIFVGDPPASILIGLNNRAAALSYISDWLSDCSGKIILCDPYFGVKEEDLEFLRIVLRICPNVEVTILTSKSILQEQSAHTDEMFLKKWSEICDQDPPSTRIIGVSLLNEKKSVIHDRWIIANNKGLRLGTSFNGIGTGKLSAISELNEADYLTTSNELNKFVSGDRIIDGTKVGYSGYTL